MKTLSLIAFSGILLLTACGPNHDNSNQQIQPADTSNASSANTGLNNDQMTRTPENAGGPVNEQDTLQDSINAARR